MKIFGGVLVFSFHIIWIYIFALLADAEDIRRHIEGLRWKAAPGASGLTNQEVIELISGSEGNVGLDGLTILCNLLLRGWLSKEDTILLNRCKGVAIAKDNYDEDETRIRPICIGEAILSIPHAHVLEKCKRHLCDLAGVKSGYQVGLVADGAVSLVKMMQLRDELDTEDLLNDSVKYITLKMDIATRSTNSADSSSRSSSKRSYRCTRTS